MDAVAARLIGRTGKAEGIETAVADVATIGSEAGNTLRVDSRTLSRRHAQIIRSGTQYFVEDLGSRNGTFLNGQRVKRFPIRNLDVLSLGPEIDLIFVESGTPAALAPRAEALRATITWLDGPLANETQDIPVNGLVLGRTGGLGSFAAISRRHAVLSLRGDRVTIEDLGSANGTWVNGNAIDAVTTLADGDEVNLGGMVRLRVGVGGAAGLAAPGPAEEPASETIFVPSGTFKFDATLDVPRVPGAPAVATPTTPVAPPTIAAGAGAVTPPAPAVPPAPPSSPPPVAAAPPRPETPAGPLSPSDGTIFAPREAAIAPPRAAAPAPPRAEPPASQVPEDRGAALPSGLAARAMAARRGADETAAMAPRRSGDETAAVPPLEPDTVAPTIAWSPPPAPGAADASPLSGLTLHGPAPVTLPLGVFLVGRQAADVIVDSRDVSRRHARLYVTEQGVKIEDLGTANGTFVNDAPVTSIADLPDGSRLRVATVEFTVSYQRNSGEHQ
jgi:pSer/pThr/pTyr-binding forkhead associated (FHA) protein